MLFCLLGLFLAACSGVTTPQVQDLGDFLEPTPIPITSPGDSIVVQGHLVPAAFIQLAFVTKGQVAEVLVQEGASVKTGEVIARLRSQEELEAKISAAKIDLLSARQNYTDLLADLPEAQAAALEELLEAQAVLRQVEARVESLSNLDTPSVSQIEIARANLAVAKYALDSANTTFRPYARVTEDNIVRATLLLKLASAQEQYNLALAHLNNLLAITDPGEALDQAKNELRIGQARVAEAQERYDLLLQGPDPKQLEIANARIENAEKALIAAQAALKKLELLAPMDGTVVNLNLAPGQYVSEGQHVLTVVDFSRWYIETDTLVENQVVNITPGQAVTVIPNALPDVQMDGVVETIGSTYQEKQGKIVYTAHIRVAEVDPRLRWGMLVEASIGSPQVQR
jgi:multidrug resistance efflux pump